MGKNFLHPPSEDVEWLVPDNQQPAVSVTYDDKTSALKIGLLVSPVFIFDVLFILALVNYSDKVYEPGWLLPVLNLIFLTIIPLLIAALVSIMFLRTGVLTFLLLGSGLISYGLGSFLGGLAVGYNSNITVTLHNTGSLLSGLIHFICAVLSFSFTEQRLTVRNGQGKLIAVYSLIAAGFILLFWGSWADKVPLFFTPQEGPTFLRQIVLGGAILLFVVTAILFFLLYARSRQSFFLFYAVALSLIGTGLLAVWLQKAVGSPIGWLGRCSQYLGAVYFLASVVNGYKKSGVPLFIENILSGFFSNYLKEQVEIRTAELKKAQESLRRGQNLLNTIANSSPVGIVLLDRDGQISFANPRAESILGLSKEEITQRNYNAPDWHITHLDGSPFPDEDLPFQRVMATGRSVFDVEHAIKWPDGGKVMLSINGTPIFDSTGQINGMVASLEDITQRKLTEAKLEETLSLLEKMFISLHEAVFIINTINTEILDCNPAASEMFGYSREGMLGRTTNFLHVDEASLEEFRSHLSHAVKEKGYLFLPEFKMKREDGTVFLTEHSVVPLENRHGQRIAWVSVIRDITEAKRSEEKIHEITNRLQLATFSAKAGVWDWNLQTNEMIWDDRMLELYGLTRENFPGGIEAWEQGLHPDNSSKAIEECQAALRGERDFDTEFPVLRPDGTVVHIKANGIILRDAAGKPLRMIGLNTDITERKQAEEEKWKLTEQLQRAEKMEALGMLAGGVAHDLNNVLGIIVGFSELLLFDVDESNPLRPGLDKIMDGSKRAAAIVQDLLTLTRRGVSNRRVLNLNKIIVDVRNAPEFENLSSYHPSVKIKSDLEPDLLNISGSSLHLGKTLFNLVSNAGEAMPKGGTLTIKTANQYLDRPIQGYDEVREGDYVVLSVSDTGEGITATDLKRIFEPFYTKKIMGRSGTGLGLAVVWGTVKDHNGYINVQSEEGKGSTFTLYFPVTREEITAEEVAVSISEYLGKGETILVVDDVQGQRDLATTMLKKLKYDVISLSSGEEAVAYLKEHKVDLLVLDMIMDPGMDGLDTYQKILEIHPQQKAIIVSGFSESDRVHSAQALGAGAYVRKPYVIEKLGLAVKKELEKK